MSLLEFATKELGFKLSNFQMDALELLEQDPALWLSQLKPATHESRKVLEIYEIWVERMNNLVLC